jgi:hypothetical protein
MTKLEMLTALRNYCMLRNQWSDEEVAGKSIAQLLEFTYGLRELRSLLELHNVKITAVLLGKKHIDVTDKDSIDLMLLVTDIERQYQSNLRSVSNG